MAYWKSSVLNPSHDDSLLTSSNICEMNFIIKIIRKSQYIHIYNNIICTPSII